MNKLAWVVLIIAVIAGLWWLSTSTPTTPSPKESIKIGVLAPLSGVRADAGEFTKNGLTLAEEEINNNPDLRYKLEFLYEDTKYEAPVAVTGLQKLLTVDGAHYIIGPYGSSEVMATGPVAEQTKAIMMVIGAQSEEVSQLGDYIFRIIHNSAQEAPIFAEFVAKKMFGDTLNFLAINSAITDPYLKSFTPTFEAAGKKIGLVEKFDQKTTDFRTELTKIKAQKPSDIFLIASPKMVGLILQQADELGIKAQFYNIGVEGPDIVAVAGSLAEGLLYPYSYDNHGSEPRVQEFYSAYTARFGGEPDTLAANSYDAAYLISNCVEQYGDDVELVKTCLYATKDFAGASGTFSVDQNGDAVKNIFIKTIKDGKFVRLEQ